MHLRGCCRCRPRRHVQHGVDRSDAAPPCRGRGIGEHFGAGLLLLLERRYRSPVRRWLPGRERLGASRRDGHQNDRRSRRRRGEPDGNAVSGHRGHDATPGVHTQPLKTLTPSAAGPHRWRVPLTADPGRYDVLVHIGAGPTTLGTPSGWMSQHAQGRDPMWWRRDRRSASATRFSQGSARDSVRTLRNGIRSCGRRSVGRISGVLDRADAREVRNGRGSRPWGLRAIPAAGLPQRATSGWAGVCLLFEKSFGSSRGISSTPDHCWFAIWEGYGFDTSMTLLAASPSDDEERRQLERERRRLREEDAHRNMSIRAALSRLPLFDLPNRRYYLVRGAITAASKIERPDGRPSSLPISGGQKTDGGSSAATPISTGATSLALGNSSRPLALSSRA